MALTLTEEQLLLKSSASDFLKEQAPISLLRKLRDEEDTNRYSETVWKSMVEMGWAGLIIPEEFGGMSFDYCGFGQLLEESGRTLTSSPLLSTGLLSASLINLAGNQSQKESYLNGITDGSKKICLALEERAHHNPMHIALTATSDGDNYVLQGTKSYVIDGSSADSYIVVARTSGEDNAAAGISLFLVDVNTEGLEVTNDILMDARAYATLQFNNVSVPATQVLGEIDKGFKALQKTIDIANIGLSAELLGIMQEAFDRTLAYLKERKQFGKTIGAFQALQHRAAHMYSEIEICKSLVLKALQGIDEDSFMLQALASMAKAKCCKIAQLVTNEGVQLFGGVGMTDDEEIGFFLKRARVAMELFGNYNYHLDRFAKLSGY